MDNNIIQDKKSFSKNGYNMLLTLVILTFLDISIIANSKGLLLGIAVISAIVLVFCFIGFYMLQPNQGKVMTLFGAYAGTDKTPGLRWTIPFYLRKNISLRVRNFESSRLKVNDKAGNPIEIATVVVWSVEDTAEALFEVDNYESFVNIQSEAALRTLATCYPYDQYDNDEIALRSHGQQISTSLRAEIQDRLKQAGIKVHEARISHLAYAPEIANAMLQRQQADAIIAARSKIVDGAVGMVEMALEKLTENGVVELDEERKAAMVSNLLIVLCGDKNTQPVINTGTLY